LIKYILLFIILFSYSFSYTLFEDKSGDIKPNEIVKYKDKFYATNKKSFGVTKSTIWLKFEFNNKTYHIKNKYLVFEQNRLENINIFYEKKNQLIKIKPELYNSKILQINKKQFLLKLEPNQLNTIYAKISNSNVLVISNKIFNSKLELLSYNYSSNYLYVIFFSIYFIIILFIIFLIYSENDKLHKIYFIFIVTTFISQLFITNFIHYIYIFENYNIYMRILVDLTIIFANIFLMHILQYKKYNPMLKYITYFNISLFCFIGLLEFFNIYTLLYLRITYLIPFVAINAFLMLLYTVSIKVKYSRIVLLGWIFFITGGLLNTLTLNGLLNLERSDIYWQLGILLETLIFTMMFFYKIKLEHKLFIDQELFILKQSKYTVIGESLSNIEHQWRTPLNEISSNIMKLEGEIEFKGMPSKENLQKSLSKINNTLSYMSDIVDDFKNFYKNDKVKTNFHINTQLATALKLLDHDLKKSNIQVNQYIEDDYTIVGYPNEFTQVLLNILSNSKDIIIERDINNPQINIKIFKLENNLIIEIEDNAKGIL